MRSRRERIGLVAIEEQEVDTVEHRHRDRAEREFAVRHQKCDRCGRCLAGLDRDAVAAVEPAAADRQVRRFGEERAGEASGPVHGSIADTDEAAGRGGDAQRCKPPSTPRMIWRAT